MVSIKQMLPGLLTALLPLGIAAQGLHITPGCTMNVGTSAALVVNNTSVFNDGKLNAGTLGFTLFTGDGSTSMNLGGGGITTLGVTQLAINGDLFLTGDITVNNLFGFTRGRLQLNDHTMTLNGQGQLFGENDTSYATGTSGGMITVTRSFSAGTAQNPGSIGLEMTLAGTLAPSYTIQRRHQAEQVTTGGIVSMQRSFTVIPSTTITPVNARLRFNYLDHETFDALENQAVIWISNNNGFFTQLGKDSNSVTGNWVELSNIKSLGHFVLANANTNGGISSSSIHSGATLDNPASLAGINSVSVYPNPVVNMFSVDLSVSDSKERSFELLDQAGHLLGKKEVYCAAGKNTITWNMSGLPAGVYILSIDHGAFKNIKILKE